MAWPLSVVHSPFITLLKEKKKKKKAACFYRPVVREFDQTLPGPADTVCIHNLQWQQIHIPRAEGSGE